MWHTPRLTSPPAPGQSCTSSERSLRSWHCQALTHHVAQDRAQTDWNLQAVTTDDGSEQGRPPNLHHATTTAATYLR